MKRISNSTIDYITLKAFSRYDLDFTKNLLLKTFNISLDDIEESARGKTVCLFSRQNGMDFKLSSKEVIIEFHSTFFAKYDYQSFLNTKRKIQEVLGTFPRIIRVDVAQDFIEMPVDEFFPKDKSNLHFAFRAKSYAIENEKTKKIETIYLSGSKSRFQICIYDKTTELKNNQKRMTAEKKAHYGSMGYFESQVTRFEIRFKSEICKMFLQEFEECADETLLCKKLLNFFYQKHRIYKTQKGETFSKKNSNRHATWKKWDDIFCHKGINANITNAKDLFFRKQNNLKIEDVAKIIAEKSISYSVDVDLLIDEIIRKKKEIKESSNSKLERMKKTQEFIQKITKS